MEIAHAMPQELCAGHEGSLADGFVLVFVSTSSICLWMGSGRGLLILCQGLHSFYAPQLCLA